MSLRLPQNLRSQLRFESGEQLLGRELLGEQAYSLGRAGRKMETALQALAEHPGGEGRAAVLKAAADAAWAFLVQREVMGLRDRNQVIAMYNIPREVLAKLGAR